jgi:predicted small metal-binding protein
MSVASNIYSVICPKCGKVFYGSSPREAKERLVEHMNRAHSGYIPYWGEE